MNVPVFKECTLCKTTWSTRSKFIYDPEVRLIGYQMKVNNIERGLLLFNHLACKNTLALDVEQISDMYEGPVYTQNKHASKECPLYCLSQGNFERCPVQCSCAYVREVMNKIREIDRVKINIASSSL